MFKNRTILILILSIVTTLLALGTLIFFFRMVKNKNQHTSALLTTLANKMYQKQNAQALTKKMADIEETRSTINSYFVDSKEIDSFISYLENLGTSAGAEVKVDKFDTSTTKNILIVRITAKGTFSSIMRTLLLLENAPYKIDITRTYLDQQLGQTISDTKDPTKKQIISAPIWQLEVSFNILTSY
ncbi:MAG: hypothetical protein AAB477_00555 [Patescibacteria group bacterium]